MKNNKTKRILVSVLAITLCVGLIAGILFSAFYSVM